MDTTARYRAYLLRMWSMEHEGQVRWRASLEDPQTGQLVGFGDLDSLFDFLKGKALDASRTDETGICTSSHNRYAKGG